MNKDLRFCTALVTPYTEKGIDYKNLAYLIDRQLEGGVSSILVNGTTAEPSLLTEEEKWDQIRFVIDYIGGKVPVMVGCGTVSTEKTIENCKKAEDMGADYLLIVTPYYNKTNQDGVAEHYIKIAEKANKPIIMYNVPARTGFDLLPQTVIRLSTYKMISGIKQASPDISRCIEMFPALSESFCLLCGDDCMVLPMMSVGASGLVSVVSNVCPKLVNKVLQNKEPLDFYTLKKMSDLCFCETNPIPVKYIMFKLGLLSEYYLRLPLYSLSAENKAKIDKFLPVIKEQL
ncbi:MAG TPA: 4-hydroxy-tetrahydrodipicolinate synthase [Clostridia bacterium]|nr:4-hydroxy-tetrahydrodipicolinate synthase [Clostridia bacterium]